MATKFGKYDQRIKFFNEGTTSDGYGGTTPSVVEVLTTWARVEQLKVSKNIEQAQMSLPTMYRVGVLCRDGFEPNVEHIVEWRGKRYAIVNAPVVESVRYQQEWQFDIREQ